MVMCLKYKVLPLKRADVLSVLLSYLFYKDLADMQMKIDSTNKDKPTKEIDSKKEKVVDAPTFAATQLLSICSTTDDLAFVREGIVKACNLTPPKYDRFGNQDYTRLDFSLVGEINDIKLTTPQFIHTLQVVSGLRSQKNCSIM
jgi:hypothetical protein